MNFLCTTEIIFTVEHSCHYSGLGPSHEILSVLSLIGKFEISKVQLVSVITCHKGDYQCSRSSFQEHTATEIKQIKFKGNETQCYRNCNLNLPHDRSIEEDYGAEQPLRSGQESRK